MRTTVRLRNSWLAIISFALGALLPSGFSAAEPQWAFSGAETSTTYGHVVSAGPPVPPISRAMVLRYADILDLSDSQRSLALDLHAAFVDEYRQYWLAYAELLADNGARFSILQRWTQEDRERTERDVNRMREVERTLREQFLEDFQLLLASEQSERWSIIENERRRVGELRNIRDEFHRSLTDLAIAIRAIDSSSLEPEVSDKIDEIVAAYIVDIDAALEPARRRVPRLRSLAAAYEEHRRAAPGPARDGESDEAIAARQAMDELRPTLLDEALAMDRIYGSARRVHDEAAERIMEQLPDELRESFLHSIRPWLRTAEQESISAHDPETQRRRFLNAVEVFENLSTFQSLHGTPMFERLISSYSYSIDPNRLTGAEPLTNAQREQIAELVEAYRAEAADWFATVDADQSASRRQPSSNRWIYFDGGRITLVRVHRPGERVNWRRAPGTDEQMQERFDLEQRYMDRLREVLTFNQRSLIATR